MCDTFVAVGDSTTDGSVILGKNSDREPNEGHEIVFKPATSTGGTLKCTYIEIPQVTRTHAVILSKPYWIWGAEMGVNEHGVAIGNEAVFTKAKREEPGLLGMDLLRLGLERAESATAAVEVITALLEKYGQGGQAGHTHKLLYDNSFIVSDTREAWILETAGRDWAAQKVDGRGSISNGLTLETADRSSTALQGKAIREQSDFLFTRFSDSAARQCRTFELLGKPLDVPGAFSILRDHGDADSPAKGVTGQTVCAHAGPGPIRVAQSTGSMVAHVGDDITVWLTGTSAPCTSVFKPVRFGQELPTGPGKTFDDSMWWQHELLHRTTLRNYVDRLPAYAKLRDDLEAQFRPGDDCFAEAHAAENQWLREIQRIPDAKLPRLYDRAWRKWDQLAGM